MKRIFGADTLVQYCPNCRNTAPGHRVVLCSCGYIGCSSCYPGPPCPWCGRSAEPKIIAKILNRDDRPETEGFLARVALSFLLTGEHRRESERHTAALEFWWKFNQMHHEEVEAQAEAERVARANCNCASCVAERQRAEEQEEEEAEQRRKEEDEEEEERIRRQQDEDNDGYATDGYSDYD